MSFFKSLFGGDKAPTPRSIRHPRELMKGDIISLDNDFGLPAQLRGQSLEVVAINTYEFERSQETEWQLKGPSGAPVFLSLVEGDETWLHFCTKITRAEVDEVFGLDAFADVFEEDCQLALTTQSEPVQLSQWLGQHYHRVSFALFGYFHREDYRNLRPPQDAHGATGEPFEFYFLEDENEKYSVTVEVSEGGDTEVSVGFYAPLSLIREYWPGKSA
ncbi:hypothetical protein KJI95_08425 [Shewanella sp. JM162201]|uniref:DUF4178 domain-containing protein n=1 Tax=Shewanella jiangmenensis TaxID=2837387 RepID=A0ABS5V263_9GAMM|nr:hypothetical protein [Shewanella jiangmenensis]MBT1444554.1 hypothetical protein [Shewanella jiangmenensis]